MKKVFTLRHLAVFVFLFNCMVFQAADLITQQVVVELDEPGTLSKKIGVSKKYKVTNLKLVGDFNGTDLKLLRDMAGRNINGKSTSGQLSILDLSETNIVRGGDAYYSDKWSYTTKNDAMYDFSFKGCDVLTSINLPVSIKTIGTSVFRDCSNLVKVTIPSKVGSIGESAFENCTSLISISLPDGITSIKESTFSGCSSLTSIALPRSLKLIESGAFYNCSKLESLDIPSAVSFIGSSAFCHCFSLSKIILPLKLTKIDVSTFYGCAGLKNIDIPKGIITIDCSAFQGCCGLTSLVIPATVQTIEMAAFYGCSNLSSIKVGWDVPIEIGSDVFSGVPKQCTLYIPKGTYENYWLTEWGMFENIIECETTGIDKVTTSSDAKELSRYSVNGQRLSAPTKGLNIVKYSDGSVKKVAVQ